MIILIQRLKQYQQADVEPNSQDMQIALSRTVLDETTAQLLSTITQELEGEYRNLLLFLFGEKEVCAPVPLHASGMVDDSRTYQITGNGLSRI